MAKLTDRQRKNILAKWHTGQYTKTELAKQYRVTEKVVRTIVDGNPPKSAHIVEAGVLVEVAKKYEKTPIETSEINKAIEKRVKEVTIADQIEELALSGTLDNVRSVVNKIKGEGVETMKDHLYAQNTLDQALVTAGKVPRFAPKTEINNTNAQQVNTQYVGFTEIDSAT